MSSNPFQLRAQELDQQESSPFQERAQEKKENPFEKRLQKRETASNSLWDSFMDMTFSTEETPFEQGLGQSIRGIGTALGGMPGDTIQLIKGAGEWVESKLPTPEFFKKDPTALQNIGSNILDSIPTSDDLMQKFDEYTEGQYMPQTEKEVFLQELGGDIASLLLPAKGLLAGTKAAGVAIASNLAKEGMKELGFGEAAQSGTKLASMLMLSTINPRGANKYVNKLYEKAYAVLPEEASISANKFQASLKNLENDLSRGIKTVESKKTVIDAIKQLENNIKDGKVKIKDLTESKRNLNEMRTAKVYDPEFKGTRKVRKDLKKNFSRVAKTLDDAILEYGGKNPEFAKWYKEAQLGWGGIQQSKKASDFVKRNIKKYKFKSSIAGLTPFYFFPGKSAVAGSIGYSGLKSYELMHRIVKNPVLRKYYQKSVINAVNEDLPALIKNFKKLDDAMLEEDKKRQ